MRIRFFFKTILQKRGIFLLILLGIFLIFNLFQTSKDLSGLMRKRQAHPYTFMGDPFKELRPILRNTARIGFHTDRPFSDIRTEAQFTQAQFILAPVILELDTLDHPFSIFDYRDRASALTRIRDSGLIPILISSNGMILARNPEYQQP